MCIDLLQMPANLVQRCPIARVECGWDLSHLPALKDLWLQEHQYAAGVQQCALGTIQLETQVHARYCALHEIKYTVEDEEAWGQSLEAIQAEMCQVATSWRALLTHLECVFGVEDPDLRYPHLRQVYTASKLAWENALVVSSALQEENRFYSGLCHIVAVDGNLALVD